MIKYKNTTLKFMGVVNITPDSFSDGGKYNSKGSLKKRIQELTPYCEVMDFGAVSTAPNNQSASLEEELKRFQENFLPLLKELHVELQSIEKISIDTFRPKVMRELLKDQNFLKLYNEKKIIWNDVSGCLDPEQALLIKNFPLLDYVYAHSEVPEREKSGEHLEFNDAYSIDYFKTYFSKATKDNIFDPCFGFSKSREENLEFLKFLPDLMKSFSKQRWIYGISRKSFLRFLNKSDPKLLFQTELMQVMHVVDLLEKLSELGSSFQEMGEFEVYLRLHDELVIKSLVEFFKWKT